MIIDCRKSRERYTAILKERIAGLSVEPCLVIIQIGNRPDSDSFIIAKKNFALKTGIKEIHVQLSEDVSESDVLDEIKKYNISNEVHGIIVQLPLPKNLNKEKIINSIDPKKDVDGLTPDTLFTPATARGIKELLDFYNINLSGKKVTVVGQSDLVGKPIAQMCRFNNATVTVCDSKTEDVSSKTKSADILIVAIGKPNFIDEKYISKGQIVIDVGMTRYNERFTGDVDLEKVKDIVEMITPVPGGVGQMTALALFENLVDACYNAPNQS